MGSVQVKVQSACPLRSLHFLYSCYTVKLLLGPCLHYFYILHPTKCHAATELLVPFCSFMFSRDQFCFWLHKSFWNGSRWILSWTCGRVLGKQKPSKSHVSKILIQYEIWTWTIKILNRSCGNVASNWFCVCYLPQLPLGFQGCLWRDIEMLLQGYPSMKHFLILT